jgi:hypothetical protein
MPRARRSNVVPKVKQGNKKQQQWRKKNDRGKKGNIKRDGPVVAPRRSDNVDYLTYPLSVKAHMPEEILLSALDKGYTFRDSAIGFTHGLWKNSFFLSVTTLSRAIRVADVRQRSRICVTAVFCIRGSVVIQKHNAQMQILNGGSRLNGVFKLIDNRCSLSLRPGSAVRLHVRFYHYAPYHLNFYSLVPFRMRGTHVPTGRLDLSQSFLHLRTCQAATIRFDTISALTVIYVSGEYAITVRRYDGIIKETVPALKQLTLVNTPIAQFAQLMTTALVQAAAATSADGGGTTTHADTTPMLSAMSFDGQHAHGARLSRGGETKSPSPATTHKGKGKFPFGGPSIVDQSGQVGQPPLFRAQPAFAHLDDTIVTETPDHIDFGASGDQELFVRTEWPVTVDLCVLDAKTGLVVNLSDLASGTQLAIRT